MQKTKITVGVYFLAVVGLLLLSIATGAAIGFAFLFLMCVDGCGGYAEIIYAIGIALVGSVLSFMALLVWSKEKFIIGPP